MVQGTFPQPFSFTGSTTRCVLLCAHLVRASLCCFPCSARLVHHAPTSLAGRDVYHSMEECLSPFGPEGAATSAPGIDPATYLSPLPATTQCCTHSQQAGPGQDASSCPHLQPGLLR